jgi:hypothetical protein
MPRVGFEPMIRVFERAKTVHTLDRAAAVMGIRDTHPEKICSVKYPFITCILFQDTVCSNSALIKLYCGD